MSTLRLGVGEPQHWSNRQDVAGLLPTTIEDLSRIVQGAELVNVMMDSDYRRTSTEKGAGPALWIDGMNQLVHFSPENQIIEVESGVHLFDLNVFLRQYGFELPIGLRPEDQHVSLASPLAMNLPHWNLARAGQWRDLVLKMEVVLADGEVVKSGANVVKSVSGYDLHKLMIGARATLGIIAQVSLKVFPLGPHRDYPPMSVQNGDLILCTSGHVLGFRKHMQNAIPEGMQYFDDVESGLILTEATDGFDFGEHYAWHSHARDKALPEFSAAEKKMMRRAKQVFDPTDKLNPGEFGFL